MDFVLHRQWTQAEEAALNLTRSSDSFWKWLGSVNLALVRLYRGRSTEAVLFLERAAGSHRGPVGALARNAAAYVLLEKGEAASALEQAQLARREAGDEPPVIDALFLEAMCQQQLGRREQAECAVQTVKEREESFHRALPQESYRHLTGAMALAWGEARRAIGELSEAERMLSASSSATHFQSQRLPIWFLLGRAHLTVGNLTEAHRWFRRVAESTVEHVEWPIPYVRSFYFLGRVSELCGEKELAPQYYRGFVDYWERGDLDRESVEEALRKSG